MSIEALSIVLHHSKSQGATKLVLIGIANHEGDGGAWPSINTLAKYAGGISRRTVSRAIQQLIEAGEIHVVFNGAATDTKPNLYRILLGCPAECDGTPRHRKRAPHDTSVIPPHDVSVIPPMTPVSYKPLEKPLVKTNTSSNEFDGAFEMFWQAYPRKVGKAAAAKAFDKACEAAQSAEIVVGAQTLASDPNLPPAAFIPHPATWLNREGWLDEPYPERPLTPEEREAKEKREREERWERERVARDKAAAERALEAAARDEALAANPIPRCEHDRIVYVCKVCTPIRHAGKQPPANV